MDSSCVVAPRADARCCATDAREAADGSRCSVVAATKKRYGLDAGRRLRRKAQFERLLREGERRSIAGYTFFFLRRAAGTARLGLLVTRKHAAAASDRNRIKRCIREAFRLEQEKLGALDLLVRPPYGLRGTPDMVARVRGLLCQLTR